MKNNYTFLYNVVNSISVIITFSISIVGTAIIYFYLNNLNALDLYSNSFSFSGFFSISLSVFIIYLLFIIVFAVSPIVSIFIIRNTKDIKYESKTKNKFIYGFLFSLITYTPTILIIIYSLSVYYYPYKKAFQSLDSAFITICVSLFFIIHFISIKFIKKYLGISKIENLLLVLYIVISTSIVTLQVSLGIIKIYHNIFEDDTKTVTFIFTVLFISCIICGYFLEKNNTNGIIIAFTIFFMLLTIVISSLSPKFNQKIMISLGVSDEKDKIHWIDKEIIKKHGCTDTNQYINGKTLFNIGEVTLFIPNGNNQNIIRIPRKDILLINDLGNYQLNKCNF